MAKVLIVDECRKRLEMPLTKLNDTPAEIEITIRINPGNPLEWTAKLQSLSLNLTCIRGLLLTHADTSS